ncbi:hypothetical protein [Dyella sp.]|uniref:hypothetical protein n=1 Tax=Dyella sp. TaxID=1869338 RepID=UPI002ECFF246
MVDLTNDQHADAIKQAVQALASDIPASAVQDMTDRMAGLVADSAARYFQGDIKAALAAQAVLLRQMADNGLTHQPGAVLSNDLPVQTSEASDAPQG